MQTKWFLREETISGFHIAGRCRNQAGNAWDLLGEDHRMESTARHSAATMLARCEAMLLCPEAFPESPAVQKASGFSRRGHLLGHLGHLRYLGDVSLLTNLPSLNQIANTAHRPDELLLKILVDFRAKIINVNVDDIGWGVER